MRKAFAILWTLTLGWWLFWEGSAVGNPAEGDTFTEFVRVFQDLHWTADTAILGLWLWLGYHFFVERRIRRAVEADTEEGGGDPPAGRDKPDPLAPTEGMK